MGKQQKVFSLKDLKAYFKWKCEWFGNIPWLPRESVNSFFPSPQTSFPSYFLISCYFQFQYVEMWGKERVRRMRREGGLWPTSFLCSFSVLAQAANCALSCRVDTLWEPVQSCRRATVAVQAPSASSPVTLWHPVVVSGLKVHVHSTNLCKTLKMRTRCFKLSNML